MYLDVRRKEPLDCMESQAVPRVDLLAFWRLPKRRSGIKLNATPICQYRRGANQG
jgi:hypothetical protein